VDVGQELRVADLEKVEGVEVLTDQRLTVVKISTLISRQAEVEAKAEAKEAVVEEKPAEETQAKQIDESKKNIKEASDNAQPHIPEKSDKK